MFEILKDVKATYSVNGGIYVSASVGDKRFSLEDLRDIADETGSTPDRTMSVAWPGQGHEHPEVTALKAAGVLKCGGSIGGGYHAVSGAKCGEFYNEVFGNRMEAFDEFLKGLTHADITGDDWSMTIEDMPHAALSAFQKKA